MDRCHFLHTYRHKTLQSLQERLPPKSVSRITLRHECAYYKNKHSPQLLYTRVKRRHVLTSSKSISTECTKQLQSLGWRAAWQGSEVTGFDFVLRVPLCIEENVGLGLAHFLHGTHAQFRVITVYPKPWGEREINWV